MNDTAQNGAQADLLFIGGGFFGYAGDINRALARRGRRVQWFEDRPALDTFTKSMLRVAPGLVGPKSEAYFARLIEKMRAHPIRDVLVIKGEALTPKSIERLRAAMPQARFTLYFWDSYRNMPRDSASKVALFDKSFTFDARDAETDRRLSYRPLFFLDEYAALPPVEQDIDLLFLGTVHSDRYAILSRLSRALPPGVRFEKVLYFPSRLIYAVRRACDPHFWRARHDEFIFHPLSKAAIRSLVARARVVVDIERSVQCGLTMRTIERWVREGSFCRPIPRLPKRISSTPITSRYSTAGRPVVTSEFSGKCIQASGSRLAQAL